MTPGADHEALPIEEGPIDSPQGSTRIEIAVEKSWEATLIATTAPVLVEPEVVRDFPEADHWLVNWDVAEKCEGRPFGAVVADSVSGRTTLVEGFLDDPEQTSITYLGIQRPPSDDEFAWAVARVREEEPESTDHPYRPFPPLANVTNEDGTVRRVVAVGLRSGEGVHRMLSVECDSGFVAPLRVQPVPAGGEFGLAPVDGGDEAPAGGAHQVRLQVWRGDEARWDLVVVRPSASSGLNGSGLELRSVDFAGLRVLDRAQVPIVTLAEGDAAPERLWLNEEAAFEAEESDATPESVPGFRICSQAPMTVVDSGRDGGTFRGVALTLHGDDVVLTTQMRAGWHRLVQEWRLGAEGTISCRLAYAPARHAGSGVPISVRAYWRLDFDILGAEDNTVQEFNDPPSFGTAPWHTIRYEMRRDCDAARGRYWRLRSDKGSRSYSLLPDPSGESVWVLRYHRSEIDDGRGAAAGPERAGASLDAFVTGEPVHREDVVLWYSAALEAGPEGPWSRRVGAELVPRRWIPAAPLVAPALLEPEAARGPT